MISQLLLITSNKMIKTRIKIVVLFLMIIFGSKLNYCEEIDSIAPNTNAMSSSSICIDAGISVGVFSDINSGNNDQTYIGIFYITSFNLNYKKGFNILPMFEFNLNYGLTDYQRLGYSLQFGIGIAFDPSLQFPYLKPPFTKVSFAMLFGIGYLPIMERKFDDLIWEITGNLLQTFRMSFHFGKIGFSPSLSYYFGYNFFKTPILKLSFSYQVK